MLLPLELGLHFSVHVREDTLGSSTTRAAVVRRTRTQFGKPAFSVCGPDVWNSLPVAVRNIDNHPAFG